MLPAAFFPLVVSQTFFMALITVGILGTLLVTIIILRYTVQEMRSQQMW